MPINSEKQNISIVFSALLRCWSETALNHEKANSQWRSILWVKEAKVRSREYARNPVIIDKKSFAKKKNKRRDERLL